LTMHYQDEIHRPAFPYKFKFKMSGCPNDCVASIARSDFSVIGTWKDDIRIDQAEVAKYISGDNKPNGGAKTNAADFDMERDVLALCPTGCMRMKGAELQIDNKNCTRCMHCINMMPKACRPGLVKGASILCGAKAPILDGAQMATLTIPFIEINPDNDYENIIEVIENIWDWWMEVGKNRERVGEAIQRVGLPTFIKVLGLDPIPQHVKIPRENPYVFWTSDEVPGGFDRDIREFRAKHAQ
jgi:sulfite reductase alpha subunit